MYENNDPSEPIVRLRDFAHEVRTPLTTIIGYAIMLMAAKERNLDMDTVEKYSGTVHEAAVRLVRICERVLEEEVLGDAIIRKEKVDFGKMADALVREFEPVAKERGLKLRVHIDRDFPILFTDPLLLNQALTNLINNAIKFTPPGGGIEVLGKVDIEENAFILVVQDEGKGIAPWLMVRLMAGERVTTASPASFTHDTGWGRGFQIVRDFAERIGATLDVSSEEGRGTIVSLRLDASSIDGAN